MIETLEALLESRWALDDVCQRVMATPVGVCMVCGESLRVVHAGLWQCATGCPYSEMSL